MDRARWDRWAPASGVLFVALALSAWFLFIGAPESPFHHSSGSSGTIATRMQAAGEPELGAIAFGGGLVAAAFLALIVAIPAALGPRTATATPPSSSSFHGSWSSACS